MYCKFFSENNNNNHSKKNYSILKYTHIKNKLNNMIKTTL